MTYFDSLLEKRGLDACPLPLWKLKITDEEFEGLRSILSKETRFFSYYENPFRQLSREACLFFAEYWRREFSAGSHSKQMVFDALCPVSKREEFIDYFYESAQKGAKKLGIERYEGARFDPLNDMLYQGGLPMKLLTEGIRYSVWDRFVRGLVNRHIDFEELDLGVVAKKSKSLRDYCNQLILGIETEQYMLMPFYCLDENDQWFAFLKELAHQEHVRLRQLHPFTINWEFRIDQIDKRIYTKYDLRGQQRLPVSFLEEQNLIDNNFFSVQVRVNGKATDTFDYANNFCRYAVISKHPYRNGDSIGLFIHNQDNPHITGDLDMTVPHLLYMRKDGMYEMGNQLGRTESMVLVPEGWNVENEKDWNIDSYLWDGCKMRGIRIGQTCVDTIKVYSPDGEIEFGQNAALYWTELRSHPIYQPDVEESVYDASNCLYDLCFDTLDGTRSSRSNDVEYRNKRQTIWSKEPGFGEIFARVKDHSGKHFVTPVRFVNVGDGLCINLIAADRDTCDIRVVWSHGHVSTNEGTRKADDVWEIIKSNCDDPRHIHFIFTPTGNNQNQFTLSIKAPFKEFSIDDIYGNNIENDIWIPYSEVDKYQYHLVGQNIKSYIYGNIERELKWFGDKLYIVEQGKRLKSIPYEGSLLTLFDSREVLRLMLDRTSKNVLDAEIEVKFITSNGEILNFGIKDSPFRIKQVSDDRIHVRTKNKRQASFRGMLKVAKLDEPTLPSFEMAIDGPRGYLIPDEIKTWGKAIVYGRTRGRVYPGLIDTNGKMDKETRAIVREEAIVSITKELNNAIYGDETWKRVIGWFHKVQNEDLPAGSLLELSCTAKSPRQLLYLAFSLYSECANKEETEDLKNQLKSMSSDLAFQWYWLLPYLNGLMELFEPFIGSLETPAFISTYIRWSMQQDEQSDYLHSIGKDDFFPKALFCLNHLMTDFTSWIKDLCLLSLLETYSSKADEITQIRARTIVLDPSKMIKEEIDTNNFVEHSQDYIDEPTAIFFKSYGDTGINDNESWLERRVCVVADQLKGKINLYEQSETIRRSIIYCNKANLYRFVVELNNKLIKIK